METFKLFYMYTLNKSYIITSNIDVMELITAQANQVNETIDML